MNELPSIGIRDKRIPNPKYTQTFEKGKNKGKKGFMKVEEGGVHHKN
jgi:hypothetical protein